jgi:DNA-directed RNA polymerase subunit H (RpoH/RPB5)
MTFQPRKTNSIQELYTSRKNILSYLKKAGYDTSAHETFTLSELTAMKNSIKQVDIFTAFDFEVTKNQDEETCKVMFYLKPSTIKQNTLENIVMEHFEELEDKKNQVLILIMNGNINDTVRKTVQNLWKKYKEYVIIYEMKTLLFNIFEHSYVPEHVKLTEDEKKKLYEDMNINDDSQLPEISAFDPVAKALMLKPDEVCKIKRYDIISFENDYYRICVI